MFHQNNKEGFANSIAVNLISKYAADKKIFKPAIPVGTKWHIIYLWVYKRSPLLRIWLCTITIMNNLVHNIPNGGSYIAMKLYICVDS